MVTNIRTLTYGKDLKVFSRLYQLEGEKLSAKQIQKVCSEIGKRYKVAATSYTLSNRQEIIVCSSYAIPEAKVNVDEWVITMKAVEGALTLEYVNIHHRQMIADMYKRALTIALKKMPEFWLLDSQRIFYEQKHLDVEHTGNQGFDDIDVYRRFEVSDILLGSEGLGFAVDISTAFFCNRSVEYYLTKNLKTRFDKLTNRQKEQQGTLLYKGPNGNSKCYFVKFDPAYTLSTAPSFNFNGEKFESPYDYYQRKYPNFQVSPNDTVALVSFPGLDKKVYVPANRVFPRVMNDMLPFYMSNLDKIAPDVRESSLLNKFWKLITNRPFGKGFASFVDGFYVPPANAQGLVEFPAFTFGGGVKLAAPNGQTQATYKEHFKNRKDLLMKNGCFYVPPTLEGTKLFFACPSRVPAQALQKYQEDITTLVKKLTQVEIEPVVLPQYEKSYLHATTLLNNEDQAATVLFVFDDFDPATYSAIDYELKDWKLKRATSYELNKKFEKHLKFLEANKGKNYVDKTWESYIEMTVFDLVQKMGCIPYVIDPSRLNYDSQLVIDVSEDYSHFSLSGLFFRDGVRIPIMPCQTHRKTDQKDEEITHIILKDEIVKHFKANREWIKKYALGSVLVLRDGKNCGEEFLAIKGAFDELIAAGILSTEFHFDFVEYRKSTRKEIRMWDHADGRAVNVLEGKYAIFAEGKFALLATTGHATLNQGTADPVLIVNQYTNAPMKKVIEDIFLTSQFNFSSPRVAQRLTLPAKRADDQLTEKRAKEIKRMK